MVLITERDEKKRDVTFLKGDEAISSQRKTYFPAVILAKVKLISTSGKKPPIRRPDFRVTQTSHLKYSPAPEPGRRDARLEGSLGDKKK